MYSEYALAGLLAVMEKDGLVLRYHKRMLNLYYEQGKRLDDIDEILKIAQACEVDLSKEDLETYLPQVKANNEEVWVTLGLPSVPAYRIDGQVHVGSHDSIEELAKLLEG